MAAIKLSNSHRVTQVDDSDFEFLSQWKWRLSDGGYAYRVTYKGYKDGKRLHGNTRIHRLITNCPEDMEVDHINGDRLDNRKSNLRICTRQQNSWRQSKSAIAKSGFRGVVKPGRAKSWRAVMNVHGKVIDFGGYKTKEEAAYVHDQVSLQIAGDFALLNEGILV